MLSVKHPNDMFTINIDRDECRVGIRNGNEETVMWMNHGELAKLIFDLQEAKEEIELHSMARDFQGPAPVPGPGHIHTGSLDSTIIERFDWDPVSKKLVIVFKSGKSYTYFDVPRAEVEWFLDADSPGTYYNENIKGQYRSEKN